MWWLFFIIFFLISVVSSTLLFFSLRRINQFESYESDDETGFFFEQLKRLQLTLDGIFETEKIEEKTDAKKKK